MIFLSDSPVDDFVLRPSVQSRKSSAESADANHQVLMLFRVLLCINQCIPAQQVKLQGGTFRIQETFHHRRQNLLALLIVG